MNFSAVFRRVAPSVVKVQSGNSVGTGVVISDAYILTCAHCCTKAAATTIRDRDGRAYSTKVLFSDIKSDLAVLDGSTVQLPSVEIYDTHAEIGEECFAIGYPMGVGSETFVAAHIAGFESTLQCYRIDASVNHGNSGGPLFDSEGRLIGIINAKHGNLSSFLEAVKRHQSGASMVIGGLDPVKAIQQLIAEMQTNLNLGIGYAIPISTISTFLETHTQ